MNRVITWIVLVTILVHGGYTEYRLYKAQRTIQGLGLLMVYTSPEIRAITKTALNTRDIKDKRVRDLLMKRSITTQLKEGMQSLHGTSPQTSRV